MKVRTITCHDCYNLGASLQAFALQQYLTSQGHDVRVIDYKPDYLSQHFKLSNIANSKYNKPVIRELYLLAKLPGRLRGRGRKKVFDRFTKKYLNLTRRYNSYEELKADPPVADVYIAGSDQIWNTIFRNGRDKAFYLDFGPDIVRRVSYAASFATPDIVSHYKDFVREELKNFDSISIREKTSLPLLKALGRGDGKAVCDPVFLLDRSEWQSLMDENPLPPQIAPLTSIPYILLYLSDNSRNIEQTAKAMREKTGWKIYTVGPVTGAYADRHIDTAGPLDFLHLIDKSQFVISNSFHATVFSLIFEKLFCTVNRIEGINERMKSVLEDYGLESRLVSSYDDSLLSAIDFGPVRAQMISIITDSKEWLMKQLS